MHIGHGLVIGYESTPSAEEEIAEALARGWTRQYKKFVLFMNKAGLLSLIKFGRRS